MDNKKAEISAEQKKNIKKVTSSEGKLSLNALKREMGKYIAEIILHI